MRLWMLAVSVGLVAAEAPQEMWALSMSPEALVAGLRSGDGRIRSRAREEVRERAVVNIEGVLRDVRLQFVQLDGDAEMEGFLTFANDAWGDDFPGLVLDRRGERWMAHSLGHRDISPRDGSSVRVERMIEMGRSEVRVRQKFRGSDSGGEAERVFRLEGGRLYSIFWVLLEHGVAGFGKPDRSERTTLEVRPGVIVARTVRDPGNRRTCAIFVWAPAELRYAPSSCPCQ